MADAATPLGQLDDQWTARDFPVLTMVARLLDDHFGGPLLSEEINEAAAERGINSDDLIRALVALMPVYLTGERRAYMGAGRPNVTIKGLTSAGRRAVGFWPREDQGDALVAALLRAADAAGSPEEKSRLRRAAELLGGVTGEVLGQVASAVVIGSMGK